MAAGTGPWPPGFDAGRAEASLLGDAPDFHWPPPMDALLAFADKLTIRPAAIRPADLDALRQAGLDDLAIHDATQVVAYFNYINRVADALGVDLEPEMAPDPRRG